MLGGSLRRAIFEGGRRLVSAEAGAPPLDARPDLVVAYLGEACMSAKEKSARALREAGALAARHESDTGSSEVQAAVLSARIAYSACLGFLFVASSDSGKTCPHLHFSTLSDDAPEGASEGQPLAARAGGDVERAQAKSAIFAPLAAERVRPSRGAAGAEPEHRGTGNNGGGAADGVSTAERTAQRMQRRAGAEYRDGGDRLHRAELRPRQR